jgi:hypothetical protein
MGWIYILILAFAGWYMCSDDAPESESYSTIESDSISFVDNETGEDCSYLEPENPYYDGGHYAGFEWAEQNHPYSCGGNSDSFENGCEEWMSQMEAYEECLEL